MTFYGALTLLLVISFVFLAFQTVFCCGLQNFISWNDLRVDVDYKNSNSMNEGGREVLLVSKDGAGHSKTVQGAVDMVPAGNQHRIKIYISPGVYREKVLVPVTKPYISFIGNKSGETVISWNLSASDHDSAGQAVGTLGSASVAIEADYFCANGITFENTAPGAPAGASGMQAVALRLAGDKAMLYRCRILGRHFFYECYIQGSIDFIFGSAKSLYQVLSTFLLYDQMYISKFIKITFCQTSTKQECTLHVVAETYGAIAASQRNSPFDDSGFSFQGCKLYGTGMVYLGRAWGKYARIVYSYCQLEGIILSQGWNDWEDSTRQSTVWFGEFNCSGRGADLSNRVPWARSLTYDEAKPFLNQHYIDGHQWLTMASRSDIAEQPDSAPLANTPFAVGFATGLTEDINDSLKLRNWVLRHFSFVRCKSQRRFEA
ncbi:hypothetical protein IEQ34_004034 [Dendrobium chrysotoxum]|uniref:Pectinesterase n=1 Tax=Dendrobium chrysotoxum TaxID=161865 RepID=A0AAV7HCZ8_DENCH|nr:hypothetical protein IEQ34_004034 [Dendrobium chrysotoxum]